MAYPAFKQGHAAYDAGEAPEITYLFPGEQPGDYQVPSRGPLMTVLHVVGALLSIAVIAAGAWWGYQQIMRDVNGVPVVRALDGPMRVAPESPGGEVVDHAGLSVNDVQAVGVASAPEASLQLAPAPVELAEEDKPVAALRAKPRPAGTLAGLAADTGTTEAVVQPVSLTSGRTIPDTGTLMQPALSGAATEADEALAGAAPVTDAEAAEASLSSTALLDAINLAVQSVVVPSGTRLVQLGAFDSRDAADAAWDDLSEDFAGLMAGKEQIVLEAHNNGRKFWRLRALGFEDLEAARKFCAGLSAEYSDCIPVIAE